MAERLRCICESWSQDLCCCVCRAKHSGHCGGGDEGRLLKGNSGTRAADSGICKHGPLQCRPPKACAGTASNSDGTRKVLHALLTSILHKHSCMWIVEATLAKTAKNDFAQAGAQARQALVSATPGVSVICRLSLKTSKRHLSVTGEYAMSFCHQREIGFSYVRSLSKLL